ncbi:MAG: ribulose-phosphate 3-epimerase [Ruminococcus bromii]|nr:ribulose-phosphate 3-epimerase [Ruminococcus bromii]
MKIAPSMLASDYTRMGECVRAVQDADWLHLDIMDGHFVPNISFGPDVVHALRPLTDMPFDVHLMLSHPKRYVQKFADAGADILTFHVECEDDIEETLAEIERCGMKPSLSLKPGTPVEALFPYLDRLYMILVMTVEPGFGGQKFMPEQLEKVRALRARRSELLIEVDGGVNRETAAACRAAGVDVAVAGTSVFRATDITEEIRILRGE